MTNEQQKREIISQRGARSKKKNSRYCVSAVTIILIIIVTTFSRCSFPDHSYYPANKGLELCFKTFLMPAFKENEKRWVSRTKIWVFSFFYERNQKEWERWIVNEPSLDFPSFLFSFDALLKNLHEGDDWFPLPSHLKIRETRSKTLTQTTGMVSVVAWFLIISKVWNAAPSL